MRLNSQLNRLGVRFRGTGSVALAHSVVEVGLEAQLVVLVPWGPRGCSPVQVLVLLPHFSSLFQLVSSTRAAKRA